MSVDKRITLEQLKFLNKKNYNFKILLLGDTSVGKSSILNRYVDNIYDDNYVSTIGVDYKIKNLQIGENNIKLQIWDTAGQERFKSIISSYFRNSDVVLLIYDVTSRDSFEKLKDWYEMVNIYCNEKLLLIVVGNKIDCSFRRQVTPEVGAKFANNIGSMYIETSAKLYENNNIDKLFNIIINKLLKIIKNKQLEIKKEYIEIDNNKKNTVVNKSCCIIV